MSDLRAHVCAPFPSPWEPLVVFGDVPTTFDAAEPCGAFCEVATDEALFRIPGVAGYHVFPERIVISPCPGADLATVGHFLHGSVLAVSLHLRGLLVLRASSVVMPNGCAVAFCGVSTSGKSTLAAALGQRGFPLLADDWAAIHCDDEGASWVIPISPRVQLFEDALSMIRHTHGTRTLRQIRPQLKKYGLPYATSHNPARLSQIYELHLDDSKKLSFHSLRGLDRIKTLSAHAQGGTPAEVSCRQPGHFDLLIRLAKEVAMWRITRPQLCDACGEIADFVEVNRA